ncbi:5530_t:CDS:2, partial [Cetraspora pellucida]
HQINPDFNFLNEIRHTQIFSESIKQNLSCQVKYNQGLGYAKKAVGLALKTDHENELNKLLRNWINETERKMSYNLNESNNENLPNITNPYLTHTKGAPKKCLKSILENYAFKCYNQKTDEPTQRINKYIEDLDYENNRQLEGSHRSSRQHNNLNESSQHSYILAQEK